MYQPLVYKVWCVRKVYNARHIKSMQGTLTDSKAVISVPTCPGLI